MTEGTRPWTDRATVFMRGIPKQSERFSFVDELLNTRLFGFCRRFNLCPSSEDVPDQLYADIRQASTRQLPNGNVTLLARSRIYSFRRERLEHSLEHMFMHGWPDSLQGLETLGHKHPAFVAAEEERNPDKKKKKKVKKEIPADEGDTLHTLHKAAPSKRNRNTTQHKQYSTKLIDLAGNAVSLPDVAMVIYAQHLCGNLGNFEKDFDTSMLDSFDLSAAAAAGAIVIDAFADDNSILVHDQTEAIDVTGGDSDMDSDGID